MTRLLVWFFVSSLALAQQSAGPAVSPSLPPLSPDSAPTGPARTPNARELLPGLPPLPQEKATRIAGTITELDPVLDKLSIQVFGGDDVVTVLFDTRTQIYHDGDEVSPAGLRNGQRVALDTVLDGRQIFARNIFILASSTAGEIRGQVAAYKSGKGVLMVRDPLMPNPVELRLESSTEVVRDGKAASQRELVPGTLVTVQFAPNAQNHALARRISILATPGRTFIFSGSVAHLDLHAGLLVVSDPRTRTSYEIHFKPDVLSIPGNLRVGNEVTVTADFVGRRYIARTVAVASPSSTP